MEGMLTLPVGRPLPARTSVPRAAVPLLSVIIVNYRQWQHTAELAAQVLAGEAGVRGDVEVMIVDNHSPPHCLVPRLRRTEGVSVRRWGRNRGFGRAMNEGARLSRGPWLLLLNPDTSVPPGFIENAIGLTKRLTAEPRTGIVGFQIRDADQGLQPSVGRFPTLWRCLLGLAMPRAQRRCRALRSRRRRQVDWASGCGLLVRQQCFDDLGGFDRRFFLYYEDVDLCRRARARGWSVWHEPDLRVIHHQPLHRRPMSPALRLVVRHSLLAYAAQHWPRWHLRVLAGIVRVESWLRGVLARCRQDVQGKQIAAHQAALAGQMARGEHRAARRRLEHVIRRQEKLGGMG